MKLKLNKVQVNVLQKPSGKGKKVFCWTRPRVLWTNLPGDVVSFDIDFSERWREVARGGGKGYESVYFSDGPEDKYDESNTIEVKLFFNKKVRIVGENDKRLWCGIAQSEKSFQTCWKKRSVIYTGKRRK